MIFIKKLLIHKTNKNSKQKYKYNIEIRFTDVLKGVSVICIIKLKEFG